MAFAMAQSDELPTASTASRRPHIVRLALFVAFLFALFYLVAVKQVLDVDDLRGAIQSTGPAAPLAYVAVSALLGALLVPGPILAAGSGFLFGPVLGTFVTLGASVGTAVVASLAAAVGRDASVQQLLDRERERAELLSRYVTAYRHYCWPVRSVAERCMRCCLDPCPSWTRLPSLKRRTGTPRARAASATARVLGPMRTSSAKS